jgi:hypothetical protein
MGFQTTREACVSKLKKYPPQKAKTTLKPLESKRSVLGSKRSVLGSKRSVLGSKRSVPLPLWTCHVFGWDVPVASQQELFQILSSGSGFLFFGARQATSQHPYR